MSIISRKKRFDFRTMNIYAEETKIMNNYFFVPTEISFIDTLIFLSLEIENKIIC